MLMMPETDRGERMAPHPLWDEVVARLRLDETQIARLTVTVSELLAQPRAVSPRVDLVPRHHLVTVSELLVQPRAGLELAVEELAPLSLPAARASWQVPIGAIGPAVSFKPDAIKELLECPLRWVLGHAAALHSGSVPALPEGASFNGKLGHRLVQALVEAGPTAWTHDAVAQVLDGLLPMAAASLLQPGMSFELHQLRYQLATAIAALGELIGRSGLTVAATEEDIAGAWLGADLAGRLDLRLVDQAGRDVIIDLKWGHGSYRALLEQGRAVQLAVYAHARRLRSGVTGLPATGYFSLSTGRLLTGDAAAFGAIERVPGPMLDETLDRIAMTVPAVQRTLAAGIVPVTGVGSSRPLLATLAIAPAEQARHYQSEAGDGCEYCRFGALCGRAWEAWT